MDWYELAEHIIENSEWEPDIQDNMIVLENKWTGDTIEKELSQENWDELIEEFDYEAEMD